MTDYRRNKNEKEASYVFDALPPQAIDMEEAVLGAMILDRSCIPVVASVLKPESFYKPEYSKIFEAIVILSNKCTPVDLLTVRDQLEKMGELENVGGAFLLSQLSNRVGSSANVEHHARVIQEKKIARNLIDLGHKLIKEGYDTTTDPFMLLDFAESQVFNIHNVGDSKKVKTDIELVDESIEKVRKLKARRDKGEFVIVGIPTGFKALDKITSGWQPSDLTILAARPGMGKTALALKFARNATSDYSKSVAFFSLEMSSNQLINRIICFETGISGDKYKNGDLTDAEFERVKSFRNEVSGKLHVDDVQGLSITQLKAKSRLLKMQHDIQMIVVDYLQLAKSPEHKNNREQEVNNISIALKEIAKELNIPVIALAQLNRKCEERQDKRPMLSDLRASGGIEQNADIVMLLYRPEYYEGFEKDHDGNSTKGVAELIIAKHRNGGLDTVKIKFTAALAKFSDFTIEGDPEQIDGFIPIDDDDPFK